MLSDFGNYQKLLKIYLPEMTFDKASEVTMKLFEKLNYLFTFKGHGCLDQL